MYDLRTVQYNFLMWKDSVNYNQWHVLCVEDKSIKGKNGLKAITIEGFYTPQDAIRSIGLFPVACTEI